MNPYIWKQLPETDEWLKKQINTLKKKIPLLQTMEEGFTKKSSTRLYDWISLITIPHTKILENTLLDLGFSLEEKQNSLYDHTQAVFPRVMLSTEGKEGISICVDEVASYFLAHQIDHPINGSPLSGYREGTIWEQDNLFVTCTERRGARSITPLFESEKALSSYLLAEEMWMLRPRDWADENKMMQATLEITKKMVQLIGQEKAAFLVLKVEREYWQQRNFAARIQKARQDTLGLGWGNHDHHTFRSSRHHFKHLIALFESLGFHCRESFYAGKEAGWGAQVMENPQIFSVLFLDVDLKPNEIQIDFSHTELENLNHLGTIGLWCGLHGESIFQAGMHHLEAQFSFDLLKKDLEKLSVPMMDPFSHFNYLKQAFTQGEMWKVKEERIEKLLQKGLITTEQASLFLEKGALGSHLENLERNQGYKGFNQKNVSHIIQETDPRLSQ